MYKVPEMTELIRNGIDFFHSMNVEKQDIDGGGSDDPNHEYNSWSATTSAFENNKWCDMTEVDAKNINRNDDDTDNLDIFNHFTIQPFSCPELDENGN